MKKIRLANLNRVARILETFDLENFQPFVPGQQVLPGMEGREEKLKAFDVLRRLAPLEEQFWELWDENYISNRFDDIEIPTEWTEDRFDDEAGYYLEAYMDDPDFIERVVKDLNADQQLELFQNFLQEKDLSLDEFMKSVDSSDIEKIAQNIIRDSDAAATFFARYVNEHSVPEDRQEFMEKFVPQSRGFYSRPRKDKRKEPKDVQKVKQLDENNKKLLQNLVNKLQRGYISKEEFTQFFNKYKADEDVAKKQVEEPVEKIDTLGFIRWFLDLDGYYRADAASHIFYKGLIDTKSFLEQFFAKFDYLDGLEDVLEIEGELGKEFNEWLQDSSNLPDEVLIDYIKENYREDIENSIYESEHKYVRQEMPSEVEELAKDYEINILGLIRVNDFFKESYGEAVNGKSDWSLYVGGLVDQMGEIISSVDQDPEVKAIVEQLLSSC